MASTSAYPPLHYKNDIRLIKYKHAHRLSRFLRHQLEFEWYQMSYDGATEYCALSYVWGSPKLENKLIIDNKTFRITASLCEALTELQESHHISYIWADAICIDQDNLDEKSKQVAKSDKTYSHATKVYAWLGPRFIVPDQIPESEHDGEWAIERLNSYAKRDALPKSVELSAIRNLVERTYWSRKWIIQELSKAKRPIVLCGRVSIDFDTFLSRVFDLDARVRSMTLYVLSTPRHQMFEALRQFHQQETRPPSTQRMKMASAIVLSRHAQASYPHDYIYAIGSLSGDYEDLIIKPNYDKHEHQVFTEVAESMIGRQQQLDVILLARGGKRRIRTMSGSGNKGWRKMLKNKKAKLVPADSSPNALASWVPKWSALDADLPYWIVDKFTAPSSAHSQIASQVMQRSGLVGQLSPVLKLRGRVLDTIRGVASISLANNDRDRYPAQSFTLPKATKETNVVYQLWRTIANVAGDIGKVESEEAIARGLARLLKQAGNPGSNSWLSPAIGDWYLNNKTFKIGIQTLEEWIGLLTKDNEAAHQRLSDYAFDEAANQFVDGLEEMEHGKMRLAITAQGFFQIVYREASVDDKICYLEGCSCYVVLHLQRHAHRKNDFMYIGEVFGDMEAGGDPAKKRWSQMLKGKGLGTMCIE